MKESYKETREKMRKKSIITGVVMTSVLHSAAIAVGFAVGFTYLDPLPPEREDILIEFEQVPDKAEKRKIHVGHRPSIEEPEKTKPAEYIAKSEAPVEGTQANEGKETIIGDNGDVAVKEPEQKKDTIITRALFSTAKNKTKKDTLAAQTAKEVTDALKTGHASGNVIVGPKEGEPNYTLKGRTVVGSLVKPAYVGKEKGKVVVEIKVDGKGRVVEANAGFEGTTVIDKSLWKAAEEAARNTRFTPNADETLLKGTITYIFKID